MTNAVSTMTAARMKRSLPEQQFFIPSTKENSCLDAVIVNGVQYSGFTPFKEFLPRSAPLVSPPISLNDGVGWKYPPSMSNTVTQAANFEGLNLVSADTMTKMAIEATAARERARVLRADAAEKRLESAEYERKEERLSDLADELTSAAIECGICLNRGKLTSKGNKIMSSE